MAAGVEIGAYSIIGPAVELREGVRLMSHVVVDGQTTIGERTVVHPFACLGSAPQSTAYNGEPTRLVIGTDCIIREGVTMSCGTAQGGGVTTVGDRGFFMIQSHIAHDCHVGNDVVFANNATLAGHVVIGDFGVIGGMSAIHQHVRVGAYGMLGGMSGLGLDVIPFGLVQNIPARLRGINAIGMRRRNISTTTIQKVRKAYRQLFYSEGEMAKRVEAVATEFADVPEVAQIIEFIRSPRERDLCLPGRALNADHE